MASQHIILTGQNGELRDTTPDVIKEIAEQAVAKKRVVVHFHGGLVDEASGRERAKLLTPVYENAGAYPVFFVWRSGALEVLRGNVLAIAREELFERLLNRLLSWSVGRVRDSTGGRTGLSGARPGRDELEEELNARRRFTAPDAGREPFEAEPVSGQAGLSSEDEEDFVRELQADPELNELLAGAMAARNLAMAEADGGRGVPDVPPKPTRMDQSVLEEIAEGEADGARGLFGAAALARKALQVLRAVLSRYSMGTDSGIYPTVVDELLRAFYLGDAGGALWHAMKKETADTFDEGESRGGHLFLNALARVLPEDESVKVTLVGHSAGAVFIDNFLTEIVKRREENDVPLHAATKFQVVLLAPAATSLHFAKTLTEAAPLIHRSRMFTMTDVKERADRVAGAVYPRSLLYLVSCALEREGDKSALAPLIGLSRYLDEGLDKLISSPLGKSSRLSETRSFFAQIDRVVLSPTAEDAPVGFRAGATSHGNFDNDPLVLESITHMLRSW